MSNFKITEEQATVYKFRAKDKSNKWADISIREWPRGGSIDIQSDFGNFAYNWNSIGDGTFLDFLCGLNYDYFMNKATVNNGYRFSVSKSIKAIRVAIIENRKEKYIDIDMARKCWLDVLNLEALSTCENSYTSFVPQSKVLFEEIFGDDYHSIPYEYELDPQCVAFWDFIWVHVCDHWKKEIEKQEILGSYP